MAELQAGRFTIIEVNSAGAQAIGAWDPALDLWSAFARVFANHRALLAVGGAMRDRGHRPVGPCGYRWHGCGRCGLRGANPPSN